MTRFTEDDELQGAEFIKTKMRGAQFWFAEAEGARFSQLPMPRAVMRGVDLTGADIDGVIDGLLVNGVEVQPLVEAELNRRFPGRENARSQVLEEQRESFEASQRTWAATIERVEAMPAGTADRQVDGEWSVVQTLRHLVFAIDGWVRFGVQQNDDAFSPIGLPFSEFDEYAHQLGVDISAEPSWEETLAEFGDRVSKVRDMYASLTQEEFEAPARRLPPWEGDDRSLPVGRCLGVIVNEMWEHHQFAARDLDALGTSRTGTPQQVQAFP